MYNSELKKINTENEIPKIIHYIWLGNKPLPKIAKRCIASWKKFCPDYEIKKWDESNLNLDICPYVKKAFEEKKFAFASDVFKFDILFKEGGIYLDIDVELLKPIDNLLQTKCFMGFENENSIAPGLILASVPKNPFIKEIIDYYMLCEFDSSNPTKMLTVCGITTDILKKYGLKTNNENQKLKNGINIYSSEYFCPKNTSNGKVKITDNTYSIHHYLGSWTPTKYKIKNKFLQFIKRLLGPKLVNKIKQKRLKKQNKNLKSQEVK